MKQLHKAVFLDRDGVINKEVGDYITRFDDFEILPHAMQGMKILAQSGYLLIVVTNQGGIGKGLYTFDDLRHIHGYMQDHMHAEGIEITDIYFCPHHPVSSNCLCRKPGSLLVEKAISKYGIDPNTSWFIGDKERDMEAGEGAGVKGILIEANDDWVHHAKQIAGIID